MNNEDDRPLKYCLYARKSSEDETSQEKSIPDQIKYCKEMAKREGIVILHIFQEAKSAKKSNNRPEFNAMIREIKKGTYNGKFSALHHFFGYNKTTLKRVKKRRRS